MEDFLKFINSKQAIRIEAFMFVWRVLMAIILTNFFMESQDFHINFNSINFLEAIKFLFNIEFILACSVYLFFMFIFFWTLVIVCAIIDYRIQKKYLQINDLEFETKFRYLIKRDDNGVPFLKNPKSLRILRFFVKDCRKGYSSKFLTFWVVRTNVLLSTVITLSVSIVAKPNCERIYYAVLIVLIILLIVVFLILYTMLNFYALSKNLSSWVLIMENRGFSTT